MFLAVDRPHESTYLVFTWDDPREDGYTGTVIEAVSLDYDMEDTHSWHNGQRRPEPCVGHAPDNPKHYKVFRSTSEREAAGYLPVSGTAVVFGSWSEYLRLRLEPPDPEQLADEPWFQYLDKLDEAARRRRRFTQETGHPAGRNRDDVAAWLAEQHFLADSSIREVWYLPFGAPPDELRLLELNDRLAGSGQKTEAIDFGLDIEGLHFRLFVADITSEQLEQIKEDPTHLPPGWSLEGSKIWKRGELRRRGA